MSEINALKVEIDNIKDDIKEIKDDSKETNKFFREVIAELKENSIKQTEILKNHEKQFTQVNLEIAEIKDDIDSQKINPMNVVKSVISYLAVGIGGLIFGYIAMKFGIKK